VSENRLLRRIIESMERKWWEDGRLHNDELRNLDASYLLHGAGHYLKS
jgi:hypothetical protein